MLGMSDLDRFEAIWIDSDTLNKILDFLLGSARIFSRIRQDFDSDPTGFVSDSTRGYASDEREGRYEPVGPPPLDANPA